MRTESVEWRVFLRRFARLGFLGFGGPPAHVVIMRDQWVATDVVGAEEFNDAFAAVSLLPGPASTQLAMWLGWRVRGYLGLFAAAALFVLPAVTLVLAASWLLLGEHHPRTLMGAALGAAAIVPAIALRAGVDLIRGYQFSSMVNTRRMRSIIYVIAGLVSCFLTPGVLPLVMITGGLVELTVRHPRRGAPALFGGTVAAKSALAWMSFKSGALSFGGGFVIVPIMRGDAVAKYHWLSASAFAVAVAIGQLTPGPVVATVAAVGYAVGGVGDGVMAAAVAFAPSLLFIVVGARHLVNFRRHPSARAFLDGAGPVATGAILAAAALLARSCPWHWQWPLIVVAVIAVVLARRSPTVWLLVGTVAGALLTLLTKLSV